MTECFWDLGVCRLSQGCSQMLTEAGRFTLRWLTPAADILVPAIGGRPQFLFIWAFHRLLEFLLEWHLTSPIESGPREQGGRCYYYCNLASEVTYHHFCHILLLVTQVRPGSVWEGILQRHEPQEMKMIGGILNDSTATSSKKRSLFSHSLILV